MSIYTKAGDSGKTTLKNGRKVLKSDLILETYGTVDELNSALGVVIANTKRKDLQKKLLKIQSDLFEIGNHLSEPKANKNLKLFLKKRVKNFEETIDKMTKSLKKIEHFILPGGGKTSAFLHLARTICRRAERRVVELSQKEKINKEVIVYLNRLSDLLFTMARFANKIDKEKEVVWKIG